MKQRSRIHITTFGIAVLALALSVHPATAQEESGISDTAVELDIEAQPISDALNALAQQSGLQVVFFSEVAGDLESRPAVGDFENNEAALEYLLADTGLDYRFVNDRTVAIQAVVAEGEDSEPGKSQLASSQVLMAQNQASAQQTQRNPVNNTTNEGGEAATALEEIVVTGTRIRGIGGAAGSQVITLDRTDLERSGFATTQQLIQSLPQNFKGGVNEGNLGIEASSNFTQGSAINLRGIGSTSTLTLLNGRRLPVAGTQTNFFDVSMIPASAVERVEVLPDGASAIYGSDAIAGVVNVILRDDFDSAETALRYGTMTDGDSNDYTFAQTFGKKWNNGNGVISYEYYKRESLPTSARAFMTTDLTPFGGDDFRNAFSNPGNILSVFTFLPAFAIPAGQDGTGLLVSDLLPIPPASANLHDPLSSAEIYGEQERNSVIFTISQQVTENIELFAEGFYAKRDFRQLAGAPVPSPFLVPASNPFLVDAFGFGFDFMQYNLQSELGTRVVDGDQESVSGVLGAIADLPNDWQLNFYASYSNDDAARTISNGVDMAAVNAALADPDPATAFNPYGDGSNTNPATIETFRREDANDTKSSVRSVDVKADGNLFDISGGQVKIALGANYREETFDRHQIGLADAMFEREVTGVFGELFFPLFGESNKRPGFERLSLSIAARYESYSGISDADTTDPKIGLLWTPVPSLSFRGTWGTSFKAPNLAQLYTGDNFTFITPRVDPTSPTGSTTVAYYWGNNPNLGNETATTGTFGLTLTPQSVPALKLDITYFSIDFEDRVSLLDTPDVVNILVNESLFAARINRNPTQAELDVLCGDPRFFGDPALCTIPPIGAIIDYRSQNEATTEVNGLDVIFSYGFDTTDRGRFDFHVNGSYLFDFKSAFVPTAPQVEQVNTLGNPADLRLRGSLTWTSNSGFSATTFVNYTDSYTDDVSTPQRSIDSWTTVDLTVSFKTGNDAYGILSNTLFSFSALNLLDEDPPFVNFEGRGYDPFNADPFGRTLSLNITKDW